MKAMMKVGDLFGIKGKSTREMAYTEETRLYLVIEEKHVDEDYGQNYNVQSMSGKHFGTICLMDDVWLKTYEDRGCLERY